MKLVITIDLSDAMIATLDDGTKIISGSALQTALDDVYVFAGDHDAAYPESRVLLVDDQAVGRAEIRKVP